MCRFFFVQVGQSFAGSPSRIDWDKGQFWPVAIAATLQNDGEQGGRMALLKCSECGGKVSSTAKACPHCGAEPSPAPEVFSPKFAIPPQKKKKRRIWPWVLGVFVVFVIVAANQDVTPEERAAREQRKAERAAAKAKEEQEDAAKNAARDNEIKEMVWVEKGKDAVKARLKDPDSAKFREVYFFRGKDNIPMTCGQVNSKNSFGGFSGFQHFVSGGSAELTFLEKEVKDFHKAWNRYCTN